MPDFFELHLVDVVTLPDGMEVFEPEECHEKTEE